MNRNIVAGQFVREEKRESARRLRREATPAEKRLWECLRGKRLGGWKFRRQQPIDGYIVDFYCAEAGVVVELDGPVHDNQVEADRERDEILLRRELLIMRIPNWRIERELIDVLTEIDRVCLANATPPPGPLPEAERGSQP
jgi:very-short-patch-repair endonuclease